MSTRSVLCINDAPSWRGGEAQTLALCRGLLDRGHRVRLAALPDAPLRTRAQAAGVPVDAVSMAFEFDPSAASSLAHLVRRHELEIVHAHTPHAHTLALLATRLAGRGRVVVSRRVDFPVGRSRGWLSGLKYQAADRYLAVSERIREVLIEGGVEPPRVDVVHSAVDPARVRGGDGSRFRESLGIPPDAPLIGCVAALADHKSLPTLIAAATLVLNAIDDAWFVVLGEGKERSRLEALRSVSSARERLLLPGFRDDIADAFAAFDAFAMPSHLEGLCTSILDAFAAGVPVVCSDAGGMPELVEHELTGLLVQPRDPSALAAALTRVLTDSELAKTVTEAAEQRLSEHSVDAMVEATLTAYDRVLDEGRDSA